MTNLATLPAMQTVDTRYTQDVIPILDTSKFEHMQRIAVAMAECSTIPDSFRYIEGKLEKGEMPRSVVIANCFRVVNQAVRWGFDPFAVMDCASIVYGKLMWEGKLVAAVLDAKLGVRLHYTFNEKSGRAFGVEVSGTIPGESTARTVSGTVADWHRGDKSPWSREGDWPRQLRYRGAREWARAHAPAVMLGIYADDELHEISALDVPAGHRAMRIKSLPLQPVLELPEIPEARPTITQNTEAEDSTLGDPDGFIAKLQDDISLCESAEELSDIQISNADIIARLPESHQKQAASLFKEAGQ